MNFKSEEEKALIDFLGTTYANVKQLDESVSQKSSTLNTNNSDVVKTQIEEALKSKMALQPSQPLPTQQQNLPVQTVEDKINDPNQMEFNFNISDKERLIKDVEYIKSKLDSLDKKVTRFINESKDKQQGEVS